MKPSRTSIALLLISAASLGCRIYAQSASDEVALRNTRVAIRAAFAKGDVAEAMRYHHPDVRKALSFEKVLIGRMRLPLICASQ